MRAEGPAIYLAQPNGLGYHRPQPAEGQRPGHLPAPATAAIAKRPRPWGWIGGASVRQHRRQQTAGPLALTLFRQPCPRPLAWARQATGALPLDDLANQPAPPIDRSPRLGRYVRCPGRPAMLLQTDRGVDPGSAPTRDSPPHRSAIIGRIMRAEGPGRVRSASGPCGPKAQPFT